MFEFSCYFNAFAVSCHEYCFDTACLSIVGLHSVCCIIVIGHSGIGPVTVFSVLARHRFDLHGTTTVFSRVRSRLYSIFVAFILGYNRTPFGTVSALLYIVSFYCLLERVSTYIVGTIFTRCYGLKYLKKHRQQFMEHHKKHSNSKALARFFNKTDNTKINIYR
jgi:hypothetical protein